MKGQEGPVYKGLWTLEVEKGSAVHWQEELGSRTDTTYLRFFFFYYFIFFFSRTAVRRMDTGCLFSAHWPRGVSYEGWAVLSDGHFWTPY